MSQLEGVLTSLLEEIKQLMLERHRKYSAGNISKHGMTGIVVRLGDKMARLENGLENYGDESLEDTLMDCAGYALIGLLWERGEWPGQESPRPIDVTARLRAEELKARLKCAHPDSWFDRTLCHDGNMHTRCTECDVPLDGLDSCP